MGNRVLRRLLGEERYGARSYRRHPASGRAWGGPMNGQAARCRLVAEIVIETDPSAIVETGTYRGTTTEWLAAFQLPVFSCEASAENFGFSQARLAPVPNVHLLNSDSRRALRTLMDGPIAGLRDRRLFFYLDAHWTDDLPLAEEIDIIFSRTSHAIVLVDDFKVPDDPGYAFDDYGPGSTLAPEYITDVLRRHALAAFYPATPSERETGARRGCVVLVRDEDADGLARCVSLLRRLPETVTP